MRSLQKLLANAAFSPGVAGTIGFYIRRLRQEELTRRLGLIFTVLAVALQSLAIISPPEPTIASGPNNIIYNGVTSVDDLLDKYDKNDAGNGRRDLQSIFNHYGITRDDLRKAKITTIKSTDRGGQLRSIGRKAYAKTGEVKVPVSDGSSTVYERYLWSWDSGSYSKYKAVQGTTADGRWFAVLMNCGNIVVDEPPPAPLNPKGQVGANCEAITGWAYDPNEAKKAIKVIAFIRLQGSNDPLYQSQTIANLPDPKSPAEGNHGFKVPIPNDRKSATQKTIYTVVAIDSIGGGQNIDLARSQTIDTFCKSPQPEPCPYDRSITRDSPKCVPCPYQNDILASNKDCRPPEPEPEPCQYNADLNADSRLCQPCPFDSSLWVSDPNCSEPFPLVVFAKKASNITRGVEDANGTTARPGDQITYTLEAENLGTAADDVEFSEDLSDVLEYSTLDDPAGGQFDEAAKVLSWGTVRLEPGQSVVKTVKVTIDKTISPAPTPGSNRESNNLELRNVFYDKSVTIKVPRPAAKTPEVLAATLPNTGPGTNAVLSAFMLALAVFFYLRNRQLIKELKLARTELAGGVV